MITWKGTKIPKINSEYMMLKALRFDMLRAIEQAAAGMNIATAISERIVITAEFQK